MNVGHSQLEDVLIFFSAASYLVPRVHSVQWFKPANIKAANIFFWLCIPPLPRRSTQCLVTHLRTCAHSARSQCVGKQRFGSSQAQSVHVFRHIVSAKENIIVRFKDVRIFSRTNVGLNSTHWVKIAEREGAEFFFTDSSSNFTGLSVSLRLSTRIYFFAWENSLLRMAALHLSTLFLQSTLQEKFCNEKDFSNCVGNCGGKKT